MAQLAVGRHTAAHTVHSPPARTPRLPKRPKWKDNARSVPPSVLEQNAAGHPHRRRRGRPVARRRAPSQPRGTGLRARAQLRGLAVAARSPPSRRRVNWTVGAGSAGTDRRAAAGKRALASRPQCSRPRQLLRLLAARMASAAREWVVPATGAAVELGRARPISRERQIGVPQAVPCLSCVGCHCVTLVARRATDGYGSRRGLRL